MNVHLVSEVMAAYTQIDRQIDSFQVATQLHCPAGCGWCCENPNVEATLLELLPLAWELFTRNEVQQWLERIEQDRERKTCWFYQPDPLIPGNGRCQVYPWRPTICRLFGFATTTNKSGQPELAACVRHKATMPEGVASAQAAIASGLSAPNFQELSMQVANIDPHWGTRRMPINQALQVALERVGLYWQLNGKPPAIASGDCIAPQVDP